MKSSEKHMSEAINAAEKLVSRIEEYFEVLCIYEQKFYAHKA